MTAFSQIARKEFVFLEDEYNFRVVNVDDAPSGGSVVYMNQNNGIAIKVSYEFMEGFVFVSVYKLQNGLMRENTLPITDRSIITCFDFTDLLPDAEKMKPSYEYSNDSVFFDEKNGLRNFVAEFATRVHRYGDKLLRGDFSEMPRAEEAIKRRAREYEAEHD